MHMFTKGIACINQSTESTNSSLFCSEMKNKKKKIIIIINKTWHNEESFLDLFTICHNINKAMKVIYVFKAIKFLVQEMDIYLL